MSGLILSAPASGSGKTTVTLGLLRALSRAGTPVRAAKSGPDYIDPRFHAAACGSECLNLDAWAMTETRLSGLAAGPEERPLIVEGAMGLFDGAPPEGRGSSADLARTLGLPVALVIDAGRMAQSVAPLAAGFRDHDPEVRVAGVILNRVGSERHGRMLRRALEGVGLPVLGILRRDAALATPSRHLGLVQAEEREDLEAFLEIAADRVDEGCDLGALRRLMQTAPALSAPAAMPRVPPPAQRIALAADRAFAFAYPHMLADWRAQGAEIRPFSPLADEAPPEADLVFLPGGYPELHAGRLATATTFLDGLRHHAAPVYGECGGFMVLGRGLVDAEGQRHGMAGLLDLETSFAERSLHLGYRRLRADHGPFAGAWAAHEFHYATTLRAEGPTLFEAEDAEGTVLPAMGLRAGRVSGSFAHLIDRIPG